MSRKKIVAGNWKMNKHWSEALILLHQIINKRDKDKHVLLFPPAYFLRQARMMIEGQSRIRIGAQNCASTENGAYTGELSASMLKSVGVSHVLVGHSERRAKFGEDNNVLFEKLNRVLEQGLTPVFCFGEQKEIRTSGSHISFAIEQLKETVFKIDQETFSKLILAYEPVWAIGTGLTASPVEAQEMHQAIREAIVDRYNDDTAQSCTILYGGSCKPSNAAELFACPDVDGGLIGGASLKANDFCSIINEI